MGALQHLIDDLAVVPDVLTSASAGSMFGVILAQGRNPTELAKHLEEARQGLLAMTRVDLVFGRQPILDDIESTPAAETIQRFLEDRNTPDLPGGNPDPEGTDPEDGDEPAAEKHPDPFYRRAWEDIHSLVQVIPAVRKARREGAPPAVLNLDPWESAIRGTGSIDFPPVDPSLVGRPGLDLRMAVTAVKARETHYVCGDGTVVGPDALTPLPPPEHKPDKPDPPYRDFDVIDGAVASGSIPGIMPPRHLGYTTYVDGGVLENVPLSAAVALGAKRVFTILAVPLGDTPKGLSRWAARELGVHYSQQDNLSVPLPPGTTNTLIQPTVEVVGSLEVHRGLMNIDVDYGRMRAEEALADVEAGLRPLVTAASDAATAERARAWHLEQTCLVAGEMSPRRGEALRRLKEAVRLALEARAGLGFPPPAASERWFTDWEMHSIDRPASFPASF